MEALPDWVATLSPLGALVVILVFLLRAVANGSLVPRSTVDFMYERALAPRMLARGFSLAVP